MWGDYTSNKAETYKRPFHILSLRYIKDIEATSFLACKKFTINNHIKKSKIKIVVYMKRSEECCWSKKVVNK